MALPTPMSTPEDMEISEVFGHLDAVLDSQSSPVSLSPEDGLEVEVIEGSVAGEDEHPRTMVCTRSLLIYHF